MKNKEKQIEMEDGEVSREDLGYEAEGWGASVKELEDEDSFSFYGIPKFFNFYDSKNIITRISDWTISERQDVHTEVRRSNQKEELKYQDEEIKARYTLEDKKQSETRTRTRTNWSRRTFKIGYNTYRNSARKKRIEDAWKVSIGENWKKMKEITLLSASQERATNIPKPVHLRYAGRLRTFDRNLLKYTNFDLVGKRKVYRTYSMLHDTIANELVDMLKKQAVEKGVVAAEEDEASSEGFSSDFDSEDTESGNEDRNGGAKSNTGIKYVLATDKVLSALMVIPRSIVPWDISVVQKGDRIYLEKRRGSRLNWNTVNENTRFMSHDRRTDYEYSFTNMSRESTMNQFKFQERVLSDDLYLGEEEKVRLSKREPVANDSDESDIEIEEEDLGEPKVSLNDYRSLEESDRLYKYTKWELGKNLVLIVRSEIDAADEEPNSKVFSREDDKGYLGEMKVETRERVVDPENGKKVKDKFRRIKPVEAIYPEISYDKKEKRVEVDFQIKEKYMRPRFCKVISFDQFSTSYGVDWRTGLLPVVGQTLITELKNNSRRASRLVAESYLSDVDTLKVGFIARTARSPDKHTICSIQEYTLKDFMLRVDMDLENCWGNIESIVKYIAELGDGHYVILKDPFNPLFSLYSTEDEPLDIPSYEEIIIEKEKGSERISVSRKVVAPKKRGEWRGLKKGNKKKKSRKKAKGSSKNMVTRWSSVISRSKSQK